MAAKLRGFTIIKILITHNTGSAAVPQLDCCGNSSVPVAVPIGRSISATTMHIW